MKALVTGHLGFIGQHFWRYLDARGWELTGVDVKTDLDCRAFFAFDHTQYDLIVHAAAIVGGRETIDGQPLQVATDLSIDAEMFNYAVRTRAGRVLYFSSSAAYPIDLQGPHSGTLLHEDDIDLDVVRRPDQSYGWVKVTGEMLADLARAEGVPVTVVRPFSGYGPGQDLTYPFPAFIARAQDDPFQVWGDGQQVRDFVHVRDVVGACMALIASGTTLPVNIGTGVPTSFDALAYLVMDAVGRRPRGMSLEHLAGKPVGVGYRVADVTRLQTFYTPTVTLAEGIAEALRPERPYHGDRD